MPFLEILDDFFDDIDKNIISRKEKVKIEKKLEKKPTKFLIKNIDVLARNQQRLIRTEFDDMLIELIKNAIEYGKNLAITIDDKEGIISFSNKILYDIKEITFPNLMDKLTTFKNTTNKNFNEGLTTLLLTKFRICVKDLCIESMYSDDNYFQFGNPKTSSHLINDLGEVIKINDFPFLKTWNVKIYTNETEKILKAKSKDEEYKKKFDLFHETLKKLVYDVLERFYIPKEYKITINDKEYTPPIQKLNLKKAKKYDYDRMDYYLHIEMPKGVKERVYVLWQLNRQNFYQIIKNNKYDNRSVKGFIILTDNRQFSEQNRRHIAYWTDVRIMRLIENFVSKHKKEAELNRKLSEYDLYKDSMIEYLKETFKIPLKKSQKTFFKKKYDKVDRLVFISNYIHTIKRIFGEYSTAKKSTIEEIEEQSVDLFQHPDVSISPMQMEEKDFKKFTEKLDIDYTKLFPDYIVGTTIFMGSLSTVQLSDRYIIGRAKVDAINPKDHTLVSIVNTENKQQVLYPSDYAEFFLNLNYVKPEDITERMKLGTKIKALDFLEDFDLNKTITEEEIDEKEKEIEKIEEVIEELEERIEEEENEEEKDRLEEEIANKEKKIEEIEEKIEGLEEVIEEESKKLEIDFPKQLSNLEEIWDYELYEDEKIELIEPLFDNETKSVENSAVSFDDLPIEIKKELLKTILSSEEYWENGTITLKKEILGEYYTEESVNRYGTVSWEELPAKAKRLIMKAERESSEQKEELDDKIDEFKEKSNEYEEKLKELNEKIKVSDENSKELRKKTEEYAEKKVRGEDLTTIKLELEQLTNESKERTKGLSKVRGEFEKLRKEMNVLGEKVDDKKEEIEEEIKPIIVKKIIDQPERVSYQNQTLTLDIVEKDNYRIPFLFNSEKDWKKWKDGKKIRMGLTRKRYEAFARGVELISEIANIPHSVYLVWYYDSTAKGDETEGFYIDANGIIAVNGHFIMKHMAKMTKINQSFHILDLICHELSHDLVPSHNNLFLKRKEGLMLKSRKQKIDQEIRFFL